MSYAWVSKLEINRKTGALWYKNIAEHKSFKIYFGNGDFIVKQT